MADEAVPRCGGTKGFKDPLHYDEEEQCGIFIKETDLYSIMKIFHSIFIERSAGSMYWVDRGDLFTVSRIRCSKFLALSSKPRLSRKDQASWNACVLF